MKHTEQKSFTQSTSFDLLLTLGTLFSLKWILLQFPTMWTFAGPISLLSALAVATWCLRRKNESWRDLGLIHSGSFLNLSLWVVGALVVTILVGSLAGSVASSIFSPPSDLNPQVTDYYQNRFDNVPGNLPVYLYWLILSWVVGGFTEEMLFRGFMITRFEKVFSKFPFPIVFAIVVQALIFGQQHMYYQGVAGLFATGFIGLVSGLIYILCKRRLWPLIISHGLANTLGMTMLFLGNA